MEYRKIIQEEVGDFDWTSDFHFTEDIMVELLSDCKNVPVAIYNKSTDTPYIQRGTDVTIFFLSLCDYWWKNINNNWFVGYNKVLDGVWSNDVAILMPDKTKFKLDFIKDENGQPPIEIQHLKNVEGVYDLTAITISMGGVLSYLNGDNTNEFWFLVNEDGTPKYDLIPLKHIDKAKKYEKYLNKTVTTKDWYEEEKLNESKDLGWIEDVMPFDTGNFFTHSDVCFDEVPHTRTSRDCSVIINTDEIIFSIPFDDWLEGAGLDDDDISYLQPYLMYGWHFNGNEDYYDMDSDEFNYVGDYLSKDQIEKLQKIFDIITPDLNVTTYIISDRFEALKAKLVDYEDKISGSDYLTRIWNHLEDNVIEHIGYAVAKNRWLSGGHYYRDLLSSHNVEFALNNDFLEITIPIKKLLDYMTTGTSAPSISLTDFMYSISNILTDENWSEEWHSDWDTSGSENAIRWEFDIFIDSVNEFFKKQNINESNDFKWIEDVKPFHYKFFDVYFCDEMEFTDWDEEECVGNGGSYYIKIPFEDYNKIEELNPHNVVKWMLDSDMIEHDIDDIQNVDEITKEEFCGVVGIDNPDICYDTGHILWNGGVKYPPGE